MPSVDLATSVTNSLRAVHDLVAELRKCDDERRLKEGIEELASQLLDARATSLKVQELVIALRRRVKAADIKLLDSIAFDRAVDNYIRRDTQSGGFVFVERDNIEHSPLFCANCFGKRSLSILQPTVIEKMLRCPACGTVTKE